jgi:hypothetical protein
MDRGPNILVQSTKEPDFFLLQVREAQRFYLNLAPPPTEPFAVVCGGYKQCSTGNAIHHVNLPYYTIEFVVQRKGSVTLGGKDYLLTVGTVISYGPGAPPDFTTDPTDPLEKYFLACTGSHTLELLEKYKLAPGNIG